MVAVMNTHTVDDLDRLNGIERNAAIFESSTVDVPDAAVREIAGVVRHDSTVLADGSVVLIRELSAMDEERLRRFYLGLSADTLYRRFMSPIPVLPERTLAYLASLGESDRGIVVGFHGDEIVGEARYHRQAGTNMAEVAAVVADAWQGLGVGHALAAALHGLARRNGVTAFTGVIQADNRPARGLLVSAAPHADRQVGRGVLEFTAPLPEEGFEPRALPPIDAAA